MERPHLFIHSLVDGHLGCFYFLAVINNGAMNVHVKFLCGHTFSCLLATYLGMELLGLLVTMFNLLRNSQTVFQSGCIILYSNSS